MKALDRLLLIIVSIILLCMAAFCVLVAVDVVTINSLEDILSSISINWVWRTCLTIAAILFVLIAIKLLFLHPKKDKISSCLIHQDEGGDVYIAVTAIDNTVRMAIASFPDVKESKTHVKATEAGVIVSAKLSIPTGVALPELLEKVKTHVKFFTEKNTGVTVLQIRLIATEYKPITPNDQRKIAAATISAEQERERANQVTIPVPDDKYAKTHATIILSPSTAPEEEPAQEDSKADESAAKSQENTEN